VDHPRPITDDLRSNDDDERADQPRVARVLPDPPGINKRFDYSIPEAFLGDVRVGTMVRIALHGRRVGGWVIDPDVAPAAGVTIRPLAKVTGWGPSAEIIDLAEWAASRWCGRVAQFLRTASPDSSVRSLPNAPREVPPIHVSADELVAAAFAHGRSIIRLAPAHDSYPIALAAAARGNVLLLVPSVSGARYLGLRLRRAGLPVAIMPRDWAQAAAGGTVVGSRAAAWAPVRNLAAVVVFDEHDEGWQQEQAPTWHARDVAIERAQRAGVPCVLVSPMPTLEALGWGQLFAASRSSERDGWPIVDVVDRRDEDPTRAGLYSEALVSALRSDKRVLCVLNRRGRARLLACISCGGMARCERCESSVVLEDDGSFSCRQCDSSRPQICLDCGGTAFKNLRAGVTRVREELEALAKSPVVEVTGDTSAANLPESRIYVGTEAVLHQVPAAEIVVFLDLDQELLAPRYRAAEEALALIARAARVVGGRRGGGRVLIQTRLPDHEVVQAALLGDPTRVSLAEAARRSLLRFPPDAALAAVSGQSAPAFIDNLRQLIASQLTDVPTAIEIMGPSDGVWLVRAPDHERLLAPLNETARPAGRVRIAIDPLRL